MMIRTMISRAIVVGGFGILAGCSNGSMSAPSVQPLPVAASAAAPTIGSFSATPASITPGQSASLSWTITGATSISISPAIGVVTGTSVSVSPSTTTSYTLTATNAAGSTTATTTVNVAAFVASELGLGDANTSYSAIELSPDMRFMTWVEEAAGPGGSSIAWLCALDPDNGVLIPADGRGQRIADIRPSGQPQWGRDATGGYAVTVDATGRLLIVRPSLGANATVTATITALATPANTTRTFPYPSRLSQAGGFIVYQQADPTAPTRQQLWWLNISAPTIENQITTGPVASIGQFGLPPFLVNVQRWFYDSVPNGAGLPIVTYGNAVPNPGGNQPLTLEQLDFSGAAPVPSRIAGTSPQLLDPFPFLFQNERFVIAGLNAGPIGAVYRRDAAGQYAQEVLRLETTGSTLMTPSNFASAEPFVFRGQAYTAYQLNEPGAPATTNGEIWFTSVFDRTISRRISLPQTRRRADPEFFIGTSKVWILYYSRENEQQKWQLRRAETGL